jgi:hypothetical protein
MEIHDMSPPSKTIFGVLKQVLCCLRIYPFPPYMKKKQKTGLSSPQGMSQL